MPDFQNIVFLRLLISLIFLGCSVSLVSSIIAGAYFSTIIWRLLLTAFAMALLSASLYTILHYFAPEILTLLQEPVTIKETEESTGEEENTTTEFSESLSDSPIEEKNTADFEQNLKPNLGKDFGISRKNQNLGDELIVQGVRIPNNPALMADAIRDTLEKDRE